MKVGWVGLCPLLVCGSARAETPAIAYEVAWTREPGAEVCPTTSALQHAVARYLGPASSEQAPRVFEASVSRVEHGFAVVLRVRSRRGAALGERELRDASDDCGSVLEATAFAIALAVDPARAMEKQTQPLPPASADATAPTTAPPASAPIAPAAEPPPGPSASSTEPPASSAQQLHETPAATGLRLSAWSQASLAVLVLPRPQLGPELGIDVRGSKLSARALTVLYARKARPGLDDSVGLTAFWALLGYSLLEREGWLLRAEGGHGLGDLHAASDYWYAALRAGGSVQRKLRWGLSGSASFHATLPWWRREFPDEIRAQWRPPPIGLLFGLGVTWQPD
jgi:hypothetical protein